MGQLVFGRLSDISGTIYTSPYKRTAFFFFFFLGGGGGGAASRYLTLFIEKISYIVEILSKYCQG